MGKKTKPRTPKKRNTKQRERSQSVSSESSFRSVDENDENSDEEVLKTPIGKKQQKKDQDAENNSQSKKKGKRAERSESESSENPPSQKKGKRAERSESESSEEEVLKTPIGKKQQKKDQDAENNPPSKKKGKRAERSESESSEVSPSSSKRKAKSSYEDKNKCLPKKKRKELVSDKENESESSDDDDGGNDEVEKIVGDRKRNGRIEYKVRWKGYKPKDDTWESESNLNCDKLLQDYLSTKKPAKTKTIPTSENGEWEIYRIIDMHTFKTGKRQFLVHWKGFSALDGTWEPEENLKGTEVLDKFLSKLEKVKEIPNRELRVSRPRTNRLTYMPQGDKRRESRRYKNKQRAHYYED